MTVPVVLFLICLVISACAKTEKPVAGGYADEHDLEFGVHTVEYSEIDRDIEGLGSLVVYDKATVVSRIDGIVTKRHVGKGDSVRKGEPLLDISNYQLELEKIKVEKDVLTAREELETAKMQYWQEERELYKRFFQIEKMELQLANTREELRHLQDHLDRKSRLYEKGGITEEEMRNLEFSVGAKDREISMLEMELQILSYGFKNSDLISEGVTVPVDEEERRRKIIYINTKLSRERIKFAEIRLKRELLELDRINWLLNRRVITAPIDGIITDMIKFSGEKVNADEPVTTIINQDMLLARVSFSELDRTLMIKNMPAYVFVEAIDKEFSGYIHSVDPVIDDNTRSFSVDCAVENTGQLVPGMFAKVRIQVQKPARHLLIPRNTYVKEDARSGYVFTVSKNNRVFKKDVVCDEYDDFFLIVRQGLKEKDRVVVEPIIGLMDGTEIVVREQTDE